MCATLIEEGLPGGCSVMATCRVPSTVRWRPGSTMLVTPGPEIVVHFPGGPACAGPAAATRAVAAAVARTRDQRRMGTPGVTRLLRSVSVPVLRDQPRCWPGARGAV